jgi:hypothetical protein
MAAISRRLSDLGRNIDNVSDKTFKRANKCMTDIQIQTMMEGTSRPTKRKKIISKPDLPKFHPFWKLHIPHQ